MADRLDVLLGILLDKAAQKDVERGITSIEQVLGKLDDAQLDKLSVALDEIGKQTQKLEERFARAKQEAGQLASSAGKLAQLSTAMFAAGTAVVAGAALSAQNYVKFIEQAGIRGDETANKWIAATAKVKNAQLNLGQTSAQILLPVYEKLADITTKAAEFANAHPDILKAGLSVAAVVATVGAIGTLVAKGIQLYADVKYIAATAQFELATANFQRSVQAFLTGEALGGGGATKAAGAGALGTNAIRTIALYATSVIIGAELGLALGNKIGESLAGGKTGLAGPGKFGLGDVAVGGVMLAQTPSFLLVKALNSLGVVSDETVQKLRENETALNRFLAGLLGANKILNVIEGLDPNKIKSNAGGDGNGLRDFQKEASLAQATQSYIQYRQQEVQAEQQYMQQRTQIVQQGAAQLAQIEANYTRQRTQLAQQFASSNAQALSNYNYQRAQALEQFNRNEARATEEYNQNRQQAREDYQKEEKQSAEDHQREMQRMAEESQDRQNDLIAARDALGLVKERRDLARRQQQAEEDYNVERSRRRQEIRQRLQDLDEQFQQERARRREDFNYQQQQAAEQFARQQAQAQQQYEERVKQLDEQHRQELAQSRQQTAEKLREIELQFRQEQIARRNGFYDILRDLNASLLNEENIRNAYYARMRQDLINFLQSSSNAINSRGSNLPGYQEGGYTPAGGGAIRTHPDEWVADKETTRALERMVGGKLTQEGVRSLTNNQSTVNLSFPGGLVTLKMLGNLLDQNNARLFQRIDKELMGWVRD